MRSDVKTLLFFIFLIVGSYLILTGSFIIGLILIMLAVVIPAV
jgi:hypothetical protein